MQLSEKEIGLLKDYIQQGLPKVVICKKLKHGWNTICKALNQNNIQHKSKQILVKNLTSDQEQQIIHTYNKSKSIQVTRKTFKCGSDTIRKVLIIRNKDITKIQKSIKSRYKKKEYILPSGKKLYLQGYEPQFLDYIFKNKLLTELEIEHCSKFIKYQQNGKDKIHFPDFYIPKLNLLVEIKSSWTLKCQTPENAELKRLSSIASGYNYILIINNNFEEFRKLLEEKGDLVTSNETLQRV